MNYMYPRLNVPHGSRHFERNFFDSNHTKWIRCSPCKVRALMKSVVGGQTKLLRWQHSCNLSMLTQSIIGIGLRSAEILQSPCGTSRRTVINHGSGTVCPAIRASLRRTWMKIRTFRGTGKQSRAACHKQIVQLSSKCKGLTYWITTPHPCKKSSIIPVLIGTGIVSAEVGKSRRKMPWIIRTCRGFGTGLVASSRSSTSCNTQNTSGIGSMLGARLPCSRSWTTRVSLGSGRQSV